MQDGTVTVTVEFRLEKDTADAVDDVRDAVSRIRSDLPQALREPIVQKLDIAGTPVLTYSVASSRMDEQALSWFVDNEIAGDAVGARGRRGSRGSAVSRARSGSNSIRRGCWR